MTNAINYNCGFARDSNRKRGNTIDIYIYKLAHNRKRRPQDINHKIMFEWQQMQYAGRWWWYQENNVPHFNSGVSSLNLHEYDMADVSIASIFLL